MVYRAPQWRVHRSPRTPQRTQRSGGDFERAASSKLEFWGLNCPGIFDDAADRFASENGFDGYFKSASSAGGGEEVSREGVASELDEAGAVVDLTCRDFKNGGNFFDNNIRGDGVGLVVDASEGSLARRDGEE